MMNESQTTTYLITGATGCLGRALALEASKSDVQLILHGRDQQALAALDDEIQAVSPTDTVLWPLDFLSANELSISTAIQELANHIDGLHAIFHCAVASGQQVPTLNEAHETWNNVIQTNVEVPRLIIKHLLPLLQSAPSSHNVFFDDIEHQNLYQGSFAMSKVMLHHLVSQLNGEFECINQISSVIMELKPLYSPLRAKRFPGESPDANAKVDTVARRILSSLKTSETC